MNRGSPLPKCDGCGQFCYPESERYKYWGHGEKDYFCKKCTVNYNAKDGRI